MGFVKVPSSTIWINSGKSEIIVVWEGAFYRNVAFVWSFENERLQTNTDEGEGRAGSLQSWHLQAVSYYNYKCSAPIPTVKPFSGKYFSQSNFQFLQSGKQDWSEPRVCCLVFREVKNRSPGPRGNCFWDHQPPCLVLHIMVQTPVTETLFTHGLPHSWKVVLLEKDTSCADTTSPIKFPHDKAVHVPYSPCFISYGTTYYLLPAPHKSMLWSTPCWTAQEIRYFRGTLLSTLGYSHTFNRNSHL